MGIRHASVRAKRSGLRLAISASAGTQHIAYLRKYLLAVWPLIPLAPAEVSIALVDDARMSQLHEHFLKIKGPTDVLTFELDHNKQGRCTGGEVIVCVTEAQRRATELSIRLCDELLLYSIHGLLHLSGMDDKTDIDFQAMHRFEDELLTELGIGVLFHRDDRHGRTRQRS